MLYEIKITVFEQWPFNNRSLVFITELGSVCILIRILIGQKTCVEWNQPLKV